MTTLPSARIDTVCPVCAMRIDFDVLCDSCLNAVSWARHRAAAQIGQLAVHADELRQLDHLAPITPEMRERFAQQAALQQAQVRVAQLEREERELAEALAADEGELVRLGEAQKLDAARHTLLMRSALQLKLAEEQLVEQATLREAEDRTTAPDRPVRTVQREVLRKLLRVLPLGVQVGHVTLFGEHVALASPALQPAHDSAMAVRMLCFLAAQLALVLRLPLRTQYASRGPLPLMMWTVAEQSHQIGLTADHLYARGPHMNEAAALALDASMNLLSVALRSDGVAPSDYPTLGLMSLDADAARFLSSCRAACGMPAERVPPPRYTQPEADDLDEWEFVESVKPKEGDDF